MPPTLEELVQAVQESAPDGSGLDRLTAAVAMADELGILSDGLVNHFIEAARTAGCSWSQIGASLGVSKQAAQQRFVAPSAVVDPWRRRRRRSSGPLPMSERFTPAMREVLAFANGEARRLSRPLLGTEHLLLGLLHVPEATGAQALGAVGVSLDAARREVDDIVGPGSSGPGEPAALSPRAKKVLELSFREALHLGHDDLDTEHLVLGLLREGQGVAAQVLTRLGVDQAALRQAVGFQLLVRLRTGSPPGSW
ncbi:MAG: ATP-dependent Clp protease ATP-binding subunit [Actinobacteria bacterium]|nr:ATP-dependent Clp protease ATP-binding subunit [Actinomycetota bacterium]